MALPYAVRRARDYHPTLSPEILRERIAHTTYVSTERKYLYCAVPNAGDTSLKSLIHTIESLPPIVPLKGGLREPRRDLFIHDREQFQMPSLLDFDDAEQEHLLTSAEFFRFTVVRNPYTRLESAWKDKVRTCAPDYEALCRRIKGDAPRAGAPLSRVSLEELVDAIHEEDLLSCDQLWRLQTAQTLLPALNFTHIGRFETLEDTIQRFLEHAGRRDLESKQASASPETSSGYNEGLADRVWALYRSDFVSFGYEETSWQRTAPDLTACVGAAVVSESFYLDEVIERNAIIGALYERREHLRRLSWVKSAPFLNQYKRQPFDKLFRHIARIDGWLSREEARLCYELARSLSDGCIVEIGSHRGRATVAFAFGSLAGRSRPIFALDTPAGSPEEQPAAMDRGHFMQKLIELGLFHLVQIVNLDSRFLPQRWPHPVSLLLIDGTDPYEAVAESIAHWKGLLTDDATLLLNRAFAADSEPVRIVTDLLVEGEFDHIATVGKIVQLHVHR